MPCKSKANANSKSQTKKRPLENGNVAIDEQNKENHDDQQQPPKKKAQDTSNSKRTKQESSIDKVSVDNTKSSRSRSSEQTSAKTVSQPSNTATTKNKKKTTETSSSTENKSKRKQSPSPSIQEPIKKTKRQLNKGVSRIATTPVIAKNIRHRSISSSSITTSANKQKSSPTKPVSSKSKTTKVADAPSSRSKSSVAARSTRLMNTTRRTMRRQTTYLSVPLTANDHNIKGGQILAVGDNGMTQLGLKSSIDQRKNPQPVLIPEPVVQIAAGPLHSVCLTDKNNIYTFGCNDEHALGRPDTNDDDNDTIDPFGEVDLSEVMNNDEENIVQIVAGDSHTVILTNLGKVYGRYFSCSNL